MAWGSKVCGNCQDPFIGNGKLCPDCDKRQEAEARESETHEKPPLGLKPRDIHETGRISEILGSVARAMDAGYQIPIVWIEEYNEIAENRQERRRKRGK